MKIERKVFLDLLHKIEPALATKDIIEELSYVWFNGKRLIASNDRGLNISVPLESDFQGGVKGSVLIGLVENIMTKEINLEATKGEQLYLGAGKAKLQLQLLPLSKIVESGSTPKADKLFSLPEEVRSAMEAVLISAGNPASSRAEEKGITVIKSSDGLHVFATDGVTMSQVMCKTVDGWKPEHTIFQIPFVKSIPDGEVKFSLTKDMAVAKNDQVSIVSPIINTEEPIDLLEVFNDALEEADWFPIPARLRLALARAEILLNKQKQQYIDLKVDGEVLRLSASSALGELADRVPLENSVKAAHVQATPALIKRALKTCTGMSISNKAIALKSDKLVYIIAPHEA